MATRSVIPRPDDRRTWVHPTPERPQRKRFRTLRRLFKLAVLLAVAGIALWLYVMHVYAPGLRNEASSVPARVVLALGQHNASYTSSSQISPYLQQAIVAIEDRRFYSHPGIDPLSMVRALWINVTNGHVDQGGSTLEEQLVKRTIVPNDQTVHNKLREIALAWAVDQDFTKAKIIELYLNAAYFGQGAYGPEQAAHVYFGVDAAHLTLPQAAFLAALPQAPSIYGSEPASAIVTARQQRVLLDMEELGYITPAQQQAADATKLVFALPNP